MLTKEVYRGENKPLLSQAQIETLVWACFSEEQVMAFLSKEGVGLSPDSTRNMSWALDIFRGIQRSPSLSFLIYGSTAKGNSGLKPRLQEIQFWQAESFLGSAFRNYGEGDLDIRCISELPQQTYEDLFKCREKVRLQTSPRAGVRIDSDEFVAADIQDQARPSFYRRILALNTPIVLCAGERFETLLEQAKTNLTHGDIDYETQMHHLKMLLNGQLKFGGIIFFPKDRLEVMFPVYYDLNNLRSKNVMRSSSLKVLFGSSESSLITTLVNDPKEIDSYTEALSICPSLPFAEIKHLLENRAQT